MLWGVAFATAVLSAVVGLAGGITLLAVMLLFLPPLTAIPLHGVIQFCSNGARAWVQRRHVDWRIVGAGCVWMLPAGALGLLLSRALPEAATRAAIGAFVLLATWAPGALARGVKLRRDARAVRRRFLWLGGASGFLGVTIGASGPLTAPFFLHLGLARQAVVGSNAVCVAAGAWLGSRLLARTSERAFTLLYKSVLTLIALRLLFGEVARVLFAS